MRVTIETGAGSGQDDLLARAYLAAVIGPFRRPNGRVRVVNLGIGGTTAIAANNSADRVLFVAVSTNGGQVVNYSIGTSVNAGATIGGPTPAGFVLLPGEMLTATATAVVALTISENTF